MTPHDPAMTDGQPTFAQGNQHTDQQINVAGNFYHYGTAPHERGQPPTAPANRPSVLHNLPQRDYTHFIGRAAELQKVQQILRPYPYSQYAFVTIDGSGGIGKSTLALEVAHRYLDHYDTLPPAERFAAIIWTSAKERTLTGDGIKPRYQTHRTLDDLYRTIAITLQREDIAKAVFDQQAALLHTVLIQQRTLIIVDNLETIDDEAVFNFIRELPAPTKVIVTTRRRIDIAYAIRLTDMLWEDAEQLFAHECHRRNVALTLTDTRRLFDGTGGVPLAIIWSIALLGFGYSVDEVLVRLASPSDDLARFSFEKIIKLISDTPAYRLLFTLSLFRDGANRDALGEIADLSVIPRDDGLLTLEKLSLINHVSDYFKLASPLTEMYVRSHFAENRKLESELTKRWIDYLVTSNPKVFSLVDVARQFMTNAGFEILAISSPTIFVCQPTHNVWREHIKKQFVVKVLSDIALDTNLVLDLVKESKDILGTPPDSIMIVCDQVPKDSAWLQIGAQRAGKINIMPIDDSVLWTGMQQNNQRAVLLNHLLERYLGPQRDLYDRQNPISDRLNFFGREKLAEQLIDNLNDGHAVALFGLRKMGKTSLLHVVRDRLPYPAAIIDLEAGTVLKELYDRIVDAWVAHLRVLQPGLNWQPPQLVADETSLTRFSRTVRSLLHALDEAQATAQLALFIDEIELSYPRTELELATYLNFSRTLRGLAQEHLGKFSLIVAGVDPNIVRTNRLFGRQNPFYNFFRIQYLPPLNKQDCIQMIRNIGVQMGLTYENEALDFVAEVSGGHPYWARKLCSLAFQTWKNKGEQRLIAREHLVTTARRFIQHPDTAHLLDQRGLWGEVTDPYLWTEDDVTANEAILLALAENEQRTLNELLAQASKPAAYQRSLIELNNRAIIDEVTDDAFWIHLHLFRNWIRTDKLGKE